MKLVVIILACVQVFISGIVGYELIEIRDARQDAATALHAADQRHLNAIHTILCLARDQTLTSKQRTAEEKTERVAFYDEALRRVHAKPCKPKKG